MNRLNLKLIFVVLFAALVLKSCYSDRELQNGDIIFQTSKSNQSKAIQIATGSKYSHMGIIYKMGDKFYVYEAVQPVKLTPFDQWIKKGDKGHYVVKRIKHHKKLLTSEALAKMKRVGEKYMGKSYDLYFEWSDNKIYCSELVWKIYKEAIGLEIGKLQRLEEFNLKEESVVIKLKERYGDNIPKNEPVISPASIFRSDMLVTIRER